MGWLLVIVGFGWALLGVANLAMGALAVGPFGLIFNMVLFILPGLVCGAIGWRIGSQAAKPVEYLDS
jgi:hypothetical protein